LCIVLKGSVMIKQMRRGAFGLSLISTKTKYEGECFYQGSLLFNKPKGPNDKVLEFSVLLVRQKVF
jgi:hypothetical protein